MAVRPASSGVGLDGPLGLFGPEPDTFPTTHGVGLDGPLGKFEPNIDTFPTTHGVGLDGPLGRFFVNDDTLSLPILGPASVIYTPTLAFSNDTLIMPLLGPSSVIYPPTLLDATPSACAPIIVQRMFDSIFHRWVYYAASHPEINPLPVDTSPSHSGILLAGSHLVMGIVFPN